MKKTVVYLVVCAIFCTTQLRAQNDFSVQFGFPENTPFEKVKISYDNGKGVKKVPSDQLHGKTLVKDHLFAPYALVNVSFFLKEVEQKSSFLVEKGVYGNIKFAFSDEYLKLEKIEGVKTLESQGLTLYQEEVQPLEKDLQAFFKQHGDALNNGDKDLKKQLGQKFETINAARLNFISRNPEKYYSYLVFKNYLLRSSIEGKKLYQAFVKFPEKTKESWEAQKIETFLKGKLIAAGEKAPAFQAVSLQGKQFNLDDFQKPVLVIFWATWCKFCIAEIPEIQEVRKLYSPEELEIISVSQDWDKAALEKGVDKYNMDWTHVFGQPEISELFGIAALPSFLLLDEKGNIILKEEGLREERIEELKESLKKVL